MNFRRGILRKCMKKTYVLDTNILVQSPNALLSFEENNVVIPFAVLEELDGLKKRDGDLGANARDVVRKLEEYRSEGNLLDGIPLPNGGNLKVEKRFEDFALSKELTEKKLDNRILQVCKDLEKMAESGNEVVLVSKDIVLRLKAQVLGIRAEDYTTEQISESAAMYLGRAEAYIPQESVKDFKKDGVPADILYTTDENGSNFGISLEENEFVVLIPDQSSNNTLLGRKSKEKVVPLRYQKAQPYGVIPRNVGQYFMQEALMAPASEAPLVIVKGMAGTAKTFYSLAVGLEKVYNNPSGEYRRIIVCRPNAQFDDDIGFLSGDEREKIAPLMRPIIDNLEQLLDSDEKERYADEQALSGKIQEIFERGIIQTEALNFIRGRSIAQTYLIIDEAQNMTPNQVKGIITRAGKGTKIVLIGDPNQIDKPFLDKKTNGLSYAAMRMQGSPLCWQLTLSTEECERSDLAMDAIERL